MSPLHHFTKSDALHFARVDKKFDLIDNPKRQNLKGHNVRGVDFLDVGGGNVGAEVQSGAALVAGK